MTKVGIVFLVLGGGYIFRVLYVVGRSYYKYGDIPTHLNFYLIGFFATCLIAGGVALVMAGQDKKERL